MRKRNLKQRFLAAALTAALAASCLPAAALAATSTPDAVPTGTVIDVGRDYVLADGCTSFSVAPSAGGTVDIDLNGQTVTADLSAAKDTNIVLRDSGRYHDKKTGAVRYATLTVKGASAVRSLSLQGNMNTAGTNPMTWIGKDGDASAANEPVAFIKDTYYVGSSAINAAAAGNDILAVHGQVNIASLSDGHSATLATSADAKTTVTAAAAYGTSLMDVRTVYSYYYSTVGSSSLEGAGAYTSDAWYAGESAIKEAFSRLTPPVRSGSVHLAQGQGGVWSIPAYTRTLSVNMNGDTWRTLLTEPSVSVDRADEDADKVAGRINGMTYFVSDPSPYSTGLVACLDGNKYILGVNRLSDVARTAAKSSIKILRGTRFTSAGGNMTCYDAFTAGAVSVTGPSDTTVIENRYVTKLGSKTENLNYVQVFGTKQGVDTTSFVKPAGIVASRTINVAQIADNGILTFDMERGVPASKNSGIAYYSYPSTSKVDMDTFVYGSPSEITAKFTDFVAPHTENGLTVPAKIGRNISATVFASKEIRTTLYDVDGTIVIQGEASARVISRNGTKQNWEVNADAVTADTNAAVATAVPAYRLYDRTRGEHIYTYNSLERAALLKSGWKEERSTIKVLPVSASMGTVIYRVYNPNNGGTHMYTKNPAEVIYLVQHGWQEGKPVFRTAEATAASSKPVYRLKNPNSKNGEHQFTTSAAEKAMLLANGWGDEGIAFYSFN